VAIVTESFHAQCEGVKYGSGYHTQRLFATPHPVVATTNEVCAEYLRGPDPISGKILFDEIVEGLTVAHPDDQKAEILEFPRADTITDTPDNLQQFFHDNKNTDFAPVILPILSRVNDMLSGTSHNRDDVVGKMRATGYWPYRTYTVENVASAAVMAGCKPEYMPVCLAIASKESRAGHTSTHSFSNIMVVNGPIRNEIGMNSGVGAMSPYNHANATIGRFWSILSRCQTEIGHPETCFMGVTGNPDNYSNCCFAENEEAMAKLAPGWNPYHVQKGFNANESTIATSTGWCQSHLDSSFEWSLLEQLPYHCLKSTTPATTISMLLPPDCVYRLVNDGMNTKEDVIQYVYDNCKIPAREFWEYYYEIQNFVRPRAMLGEGDQAEYWDLYQQDPDALMPYFARMGTGRMTVLVVGGATNPFWRIWQCFSVGTPTPIDPWR
jgi:hypothetical protein